MPAASIAARVSRASRDCVRDGLAALGGRAQMLRAAVIRVDAAKAKRRRARDDLRERHRGRSRRDAAAIHADLDLDQHVERRARCFRRCTEMADVRRVVDQHANRRFVRHRREPRELRRADDLVGDEHVADARCHERFGFPYLLAADADRPALDLLLRDVGALVRLRVRTERDAGAARRMGHQVEVALEGIEVDHERGGVDVVNGVADAGGNSLHGRNRTAQMPEAARFSGRDATLLLGGAASRTANWA